MKRNSILRAASAAVVISLAGQATATADVLRPVQSTEDFDDIIVTATRYPLPRDEVLPASIVIERAELQRSLANDVTDVLRFYAGMEFGRNGGPGQTASLFMRGTESNHTLVLVDGIRINPGTVGGAALWNISPDLVQRIEVVKGPRSTLYGTDAIGGVVQIFTHAQHADGLATQLGYGEDSTVIGSASGGWGSDTAHIGFGVSYEDTDGFAPRQTDPRGGAYDNLGFNVAGSLDAGPGTLGLTYWHAGASADYIGFSSRTFGNALVTQDYTNDVGGVNYAWTLDKWSSKVEASYMVDDIEQQQVEDSLGRFESDDFSTTHRTSVGWQNDFDLSSTNRFSAGATLYSETAETPQFGDIDTDVANVYVEDRIALDRHTIVVALGYLDHEAFGGHTTWNAEYGLQLGDAVRLIASAGTAFRAPDATDRFGFAGNPDLEPEESTNYELGLRYSIDERQRLSISAFQNDIDELITYVFSINRLENVERARIRGIEAGYELTGEDWRLRAEAIYQDPEDRGTGNQLLRRARQNFTFSGVKQFGPIELGLDVLAAGKREDFSSELDSYVLTNFTARYDIGAGWAVVARVENLLDEEYELADGYNTQDRNLFLGVRYNPGRR